MSDKRPEDVLQELDDLEVTELDDKQLEGVAGGLVEEGCLNGNCNGCAPGTKDPNGCSNSNCDANLD